MTDRNQNSNDKLSTALTVISFLIPLVGAILYFSYKKDSPNKSKSACHSALWGLGIGIVFQIIVVLVS